MHIFQCIHRCIHALGKWEIKWAKTASPPIHVASQYESINVSPPSGLSVNQFSPRLSALATSSSTNGLFRNGRFSKRDSPSVPWHSCVDTSSRTLRRASISSRSVRGWRRMRWTIRCFSLKSNILNGSKCVVFLQREVDRVFLKVWWSREYLWY